MIKKVTFKLYETYKNPLRCASSLRSLSLSLESRHSTEPSA